MSDTKNLQDSYNWKKIAGYALYDWASSPVPTLHATFIFAVYFTTKISPENGTSYWGYMTALASFSVAILSPFLGALADSLSARKLLLLVFTLFGAISTMSLWLIYPNQNLMITALVISFFSILSMELTFVFYNSLLQSVASTNNIGRVSGISWGCGYFGAITCLAFVLFFFIQNENPPFGLVWEDAVPIRATMIISGLWLLIFSIPTFVFVKEIKTPLVSFSPLTRLKEGWSTILKTPGLLKFLIARMFYTDGLTVVFAFAGIYAAKVFGFPQDKVIIFAIIVNVFCGIGAIAGGLIEDKIGAFSTIRLSLIALLVLGCGLLLSPSEIWFWAFGLLTGLFIGPVQSSSRSLVSHVSPPEHKAKIFGFYMFAGKSTSFLGPAIYGWLVMVSGFERSGMIIVILFFILGLIILGNKSPKQVSQF